MKKSSLSVIFDWFEFTLLETTLSSALDTIGLKWEDFSSLDKGRFGYHNQLKWNNGNIFVMFTAVESGELTESTRVNRRSGIHIMITGQGCRQYSVKHDLHVLNRRLHDLPKVNFSRIDLAVDDFESKIIDYQRINEAALAGHFTSRWSKWDEINSRHTTTGDFLGRTMYFGSQASDIFCRVYDKTLERKANAKTEKEVPQKWTRLEVVYKKDRARKLADFISEGKFPIGHALRGTLKQYLRFLVPIDDKNKARWPSATWWDILLKDVDALQLTIEKEPKTINDMINWVDQQISPTLSTIIQAHQGDMAWFKYILVKGGERLSQKHKDAIKQYQLAKEQGV